jgi:predicted Zn-dependent protease
LADHETCADAIAGALGAAAQYGVLLPYSRNQELEADRFGLELMARAGYDPREALAFWQRMQRQGVWGAPCSTRVHRELLNSLWPTAAAPGRATLRGAASPASR